MYIHDNTIHPNKNFARLPTTYLASWPSACPRQPRTMMVYWELFTLWRKGGDTCAMVEKSAEKKNEFKKKYAPRIPYSYFYFVERSSSKTSRHHRNDIKKE